MKVVAPTGAARRRLGLAFAIQKRLCNSASPAPRGQCDSYPQTRANYALLGHWRAPSGRPRCGRLPSLSLGSPRRGAAALAFSRALLFPTMALPRSPCRRWRCALRFPNDCPWDFHPRARLVRAPLVPKVALALPSGAGRGLRWLLVRVPLLRAICGHSARDGGDAGGDAAQNRARQFRVKQVCSEVAALGFPPYGGRRPLSNELPRVAVRGGAQAPRRWWSFL